MKIINKDSIKILNIIGSPFDKNNISFTNYVDKHLSEYAKSNHIYFLFLESLNNHCIDIFKKEFINLTKKYNNQNITIIEIAHIFEKNDVKYSFFKSIRPYREVTVDIDIIIFNDYKKAIQKLRESRYKLIETGPLSSTFWDKF